MSATQSPSQTGSSEPEKAPTGISGEARPRTLAGQSIGAALVAASVGMVTALLGRYFVPSVIVTTPAEQFGDQFTALIPLPIFEALLNTFDGNAKHIYVGGVIVVEALLTAAVGIAYVAARQAIRLWLLRRPNTPGAAPESLTPAGRFGRTQFGNAAPSYFEAALIVLVLWALSAGILA